MQIAEALGLIDHNAGRCALAAQLEEAARGRASDADVLDAWLELLAIRCEAASHKTLDHLSGGAWSEEHRQGPGGELWREFLAEHWRFVAIMWPSDIVRWFDSRMPSRRDRRGADRGSRARTPRRPGIDDVVVILAAGQ